MLYKYSFKYPSAELSALNVCSTGLQRCEPDYSWGPGVRDHYLMHYVITGRKPSDLFLTVAQTLGMVLLLALMFLAFGNDISRII